jgi:P27 family predicted phage terminase small subunit
MTVGRKPKPTKMKVVQGTFRKDRANINEPKLKNQLPPCPDFLEGKARQEYFRIGRKLERIGVLTEIDDLALICLCQSWAEFIEATEQARKTGMLVKSPSGYPILNPYVTLANQALKRVKSFLTEFGMTPSSRCRVNADPDETGGDNPWNVFL